LKSDLLKSFIDSFQAGLTAEMYAMQNKLGPYEIHLANMKELQTVGRLREYSFSIRQNSERLVPGLECTLKIFGREFTVTIVTPGEEGVVVRSEQELPDGASDYTLVVYPWFLLEKLQEALIGIQKNPDFNIDNGMRLFGRKPRILVADRNPPASYDLNESQTQALALSLKSNPALVWGPPGTGKTTTLAAIVQEHLSLGRRILIASTTNAAIDQLLAVLVRRSPAHLIQGGRVVRMGQGRTETFGTGIGEVVRAAGAEKQEQIASLREVRDRRARQIGACRKISDAIEKQASSRQVSMFAPRQEETPAAVEEMTAVFGERRVASILLLDTAGQRLIVQRRLARLESARRLVVEKIAALRQVDLDLRQKAVKEARVILATLSNVYVNQLLASERFDTVIVDEAGMAVLPMLFYCACLARESVILAGDPRQLPAIIHSDDDLAYKVLGRNIFDILAASEEGRQCIQMLDTQYRMHPKICALVAESFYDGRLLSGGITSSTEGIAELAPYAGAPLVVYDTAGSTTCETRDGSFSRFSAGSARICVELAGEAFAAGIRSLAIITPYNEQARLISRMLAERGGLPEDFECATVHRFQGNERDMIIFDAVDTDPLRPGVMLNSNTPRSRAANLINVSLSRARGKLVIVADRAYFGRNPGLLSHILDRALEIGGLHVSPGESREVL
jgi:hypothetical protein